MIVSRPLQKLSTPLIASLFLSLAAVPALHAQPGIDSPPKILVIQREFLKPGRAGSTHEKTERAFIQASLANKSTSFYFGMDSMSGPSRSLFFQAYNSFAEWEKDSLGVQKNAGLAAAFDHASLVDGENLSAYDTMVVSLRPDLSLHPMSLKGVRYFDITRFDVKPGHEQELEDLEKIYAGFYKDLPNANWATFQTSYGTTEGTTYLVIQLYKSLAEVDQNILDSAKFMETIGAKGQKRMAELTASCMLAQQTNLFQVNPRISFPAKPIIDAEPGFWKPKPTAAAPKPAAPAQ